MSPDQLIRARDVLQVHLVDQWAAAIRDGRVRSTPAERRAFKTLLHLDQIAANEELIP